jgi:hypothetical protein
MKHKFQYEYNNEDEEREEEETIAVFHSSPGKPNNPPTVPTFHQTLAAASFRAWLQSYRYSYKRADGHWDSESVKLRESTF